MMSVPWRSCLQLSHRRPPKMCGLQTRPRTDVDPPPFLPPSNCHRRGGLSSRRSGRYLIIRPHRTDAACCYTCRTWRGLCVCLLGIPASRAKQMNRSRCRLRENNTNFHYIIAKMEIKYKLSFLTR